jgi:PPP family 3-phenylpropionic acid transporter
MIFTIGVHSTLSFYNAFFAIYYRNMGADNGLLGWSIFIASVSEVFFLLYGDKVITKFGIKRTLFSAAFIAVIRWALFAAITDIYIILILQLLHGLIFIVLAYSMSMYINNKVPDELKASGQTLNAVVSMGISKIIGNIGGGMLSDVIGIKQVFLCSSITVIVFILVFGVIFLLIGKNTDQYKRGTA